MNQENRTKNYFLNLEKGNCKTEYFSKIAEVEKTDLNTFEQVEPDQFKERK